MQSVQHTEPSNKEAYGNKNTISTLVRVPLSKKSMAKSDDEQNLQINVISIKTNNESPPRLSTRPFFATKTELALHFPYTFSSDKEYDITCSLENCF